MVLLSNDAKNHHASRCRSYLRKDESKIEIEKGKNKKNCFHEKWNRYRKLRVIEDEKLYKE